MKTLLQQNEHVCLNILIRKQKVKRKRLFDNHLVMNVRKEYDEAKAKHQHRSKKKELQTN